MAVCRTPVTLDTRGNRGCESGFPSLKTVSTWHPERMAKEIDPVRARSAVAVIRAHPGMVLFLATPALLVVGVVWLLTGSAAWAALLVVALALGGGAALYAGVKRR
jgi:hypothetical protein